jgi:hypothetical protein
MIAPSPFATHMATDNSGIQDQSCIERTSRRSRQVLSVPKVRQVKQKRLCRARPTNARIFMGSNGLNQQELLVENTYREH